MLALRTRPEPPPRTDRILDAAATLHLLRTYASVVAVRPLQVGNQEFLASLLAACRSLADALDGAANPAVAPIRDLVARLRIESAVHVASEIVHLADEAAERLGPEEPLFVQGLSCLDEEYDRITVVFGPGIGFGDEVTFAGLVRALARRWPDAWIVVFTLYPGLWKQLLPSIHERHYRRNPLRPFADLKARQDEGRQLVVVADFELFDIAGKVIPRRRRRDVLEVSLGRRQARLVEGASPWTHWEVFDTDDGNNYASVQAIAERVLGRTTEREAWQPLRPLRPAQSARLLRRLLLNPLSSKPLPFGVEGWARLAADVAERLPRDARIEVVVYPGLHAATEAYAGELCSLLGRVGPTISARALVARDGARLTPTNATPALADALEQADVCVTLDTSTAHLAPLYGVPTAVVAYHDNHAFWVPAPWAVYTLLDEVEGSLPPLVARLLLRGRRGGSVRGAPELAEATRYATETGLGRETVEGILQPLARCLAQLDPDFPYADEGRRWLTLWSRVGSALRREPLPPERLYPFLREWRRSAFFRLATTSQERGWSG